MTPALPLGSAGVSQPHVNAEGLQAGGPIIITGVAHHHHYGYTTGGEPPEFTPTFDAVKGHLDQYEVSAALGILTKLEKDRAGSFTPYTWFRFYGLRGHAYRHPS